MADILFKTDDYIFLYRVGGVYESTVHEPLARVDLKRFWITL